MEELFSIILYTYVVVSTTTISLMVTNVINVPTYITQVLMVGTDVLSTFVYITQVGTNKPMPPQVGISCDEISITDGVIY